ncbi:MAG TPA: hypothetical protein VMV71_00080 [Candidatus Paceibacterota bacterium]|nr:hypothetical protein [Candidatus Paceibacterota bacterium]
MFKEIFEQPANFGNENEGISDEEKKLMEAEKRLQELMDRATKTLERAEANKFISESDAEKLHALLKQINEKIAAEDSTDINEALSRLEVLGNSLKLPGDKEEEAGVLLEALEKWAREKSTEAGKPENNHKHKGRRAGGFYLSSNRNSGKKRGGAEPRVDN